MFFRFATSFVAVLGLGQAAMAALTPSQVVDNIKIVATISSSTNAALVPLNIKSSPDEIRTIGSNLVTDFNLIIQDLAGDVKLMDQTPAFNDVDAQSVVDALTDFITIHQILLGTVIGKQTFFAQFGVTAPIAGVLRSLEAGVDAFALSMIALIPTRKTTVQTGAGQLGDTLTTARNKYEELCIPSPLYPRLLPICVSL